ncbi:hypothetical protein ACT3SZ_13065 [Corynebacterium sp. AOP40-9SA-29]|uniref:hypothetical protein n=1 Tax=Corynebacterium sp. AOP40-9SA-29 TaxID=3457677 RepID=UPI004034D4C5
MEHANAGAASGLFDTAVHLGMALGTALTGVVIWALMFLIPGRTVSMAKENAVVSGEQKVSG